MRYEGLSSDMTHHVGHRNSTQIVMSNLILRRKERKKNKQDRKLICPIVHGALKCTSQRYRRDSREVNKPADKQTPMIAIKKCNTC